MENTQIMKKLKHFVQEIGRAEVFTETTPVTGLTSHILIFNLYFLKTLNINISIINFNN